MLFCFFLGREQKAFKPPVTFAVKMAKAKATVSAVKVKKKIWYPIVAPKSFHNPVLGETYVTDPAVAVGRVIHANLREITDSMQDQHVYMVFKITHVENNQLHTETVACYMTPPTIKKLTRRTASRMDESFVLVTKDAKRVRIKPVIVTVNKTVRSVCSELRRAVQAEMAKDVALLTWEELVMAVVTHKLQSDVKKRVSKVYPVKIIDIKKLEFARLGKAVKVKKGSQAAEQPVEEATPVEESEKPKKPRKKKTITEEMTEELLKTPQEMETAETPEKKEEVEESENFGEEESTSA